MKVKILFAICNYGDSQKSYLIQLLDELSNFQKYEVKVFLFSNFANEDILKKYLNKLSIEEFVYTKEKYVPEKSEIGNYLHHMHKAFFINEKNNYDIFVNTDNDHLYLEKHFDVFIKINDIIKKENPNIIPGLIQYEENSSENKRLIGLHPRHTPNFLYDKKIFKINNLTCISHPNPHQASYIITKEHLEISLIDNNYLKIFRRDDLRVAAVTDIYQFCNLNKLIFLDFYDDLLIHHLPDKYDYLSDYDENTFKKDFDIYFSKL